MSSGDFNLLHLRNLKMYNPEGAYPTVSSIFTIGSNGVPVYTNDIAVRDVAVSTLTASTLTASTATLSTLGVGTRMDFSTMFGSSITASTATLSTLGVTTQMDFSTMFGSSITASTATLSTLGVGTRMDFSTMFGSSIVASTATVSTLGVSAQLGVSSLLASTVSTNLLTASDIQLQSTAIALGLSTTSTQTNFSQGSYAPSSWTLAKSGITNVRKLASSSGGQYQLVASEATNNVWLSSDSGVTWSALTTAASGLPTLSGSASWSAGSVSASGQKVMLAVDGGSLWFSEDYGRTFNESFQSTPDIWLPLDGSTTDMMGVSTVTATGAPGYVSLEQPGYSGKAIQLSNVAGGTATKYVRGTRANSEKFTVSFSFNIQELPSSGNTSNIFSTGESFNGTGFRIRYLNNVASFTGLSIIYFDTNGNGNIIGLFTSTIQINTWYSIYVIVDTVGTCYAYLNGVLLGSISGKPLYSSNTVFSIGTYAHAEADAFNGHIADLKIYNSAIPYKPIPHLAPNYWLPMEGSVADSGSYGAVQKATPFVYLPFEGSVTDQQGNSTVTATGSPSYVPSGAKGASGTQAIQLSNTAGGTATQYVRGTWAGSSSFTVSFWFNAQSVNGVQQTLVSAYASAFQVYINTSNQIVLLIPTGGGTNASNIATTSSAIIANTWYYVSAIFQTSGLCSFYVNNILIGSATNTSGVGTLTTSAIGLGTYDNSTGGAFNGLIDDFRLWNTAFVDTPLSSVNAEPTIYLPLEGSVVDQQGVSTVTATGSPAYTTSVRAGALGTQAINLANTAGSNATQYVRGTWAGAPNFTVSFWFNAQTINVDYQYICSAYNGVFAITLSSNNRITFVFPSNGGSNFDFIESPTSFIQSNTWYYITVIFQTSGLCSFYVNNSLIGSAVNTQGVGSSTTSNITLGGFDSIGVTSAFNGYIDDFKLYNYVPSPLIPAIYLPFEGSVADAQGTSAVTATGSPAYTSSVRVGATGIRALNLVNTAGGTATQYVRGAWAGAPNFTVSFWFNAQTINVDYQYICSAYNGAFAITLNSNNRITFVFPSNGGSNYDFIESPTSFIQSNTWYYITVIFQTSGLCSFYVNNSLIGSAVNTQGVGSSTTSNITLGGFDSIGVTSAFNGLIDDFRLWNSAIPYVPVSVVQPTGTMAYVPGAVGKTALNLVNTAGGTATNYVRGAWAGSSNFTVSLWFNVQTLNQNQVIMIGLTGGFNLILLSTNDLYCYLPSGTGLDVISINTPFQLLSNTWYFVTIVFQTNGTCSMYLNNSLIGTVVNSGGLGSFPSTSFSLGASSSLSFAFNGYIDDFRLYNSAIPYTSLFPSNYTHVAMSGDAQTLMAANRLGRLYLSSDAGVSFAQQDAAATPGAWSSLSASYSGKYLTAQSQPVVQPNQLGLSAATWSQQGVTYTATSSSILSATFEGQYAFNNFYGSISNVNPYSWAGSVSTGNYDISTGNYIGSGNVTTTIQGGVGVVAGEWLQLQTSAPLVLQSYRFACGGYGNLPRVYYIVGSNDGSTWYPLQYVSMASNPLNTNFTTFNSDILMNYTGTQTVQGAITASGSTVGYSYTTQPFQYFRIVVNKIYGGAGFAIAELGEWFMNFAGGCIMPNQSGLSADTWLNSGVSWVATASSASDVSRLSYNAFNNSVSSGWASVASYNTSTGSYSAGTYSTTILGGVGVVSGDWIQLQSSLPLVLQSYSYASYDSGPQFMKTYYIVGSNDGSSWYPLQYVNLTTNPFTASVTYASTQLIVNYTGTQTIQGNQTGSGSTIAYAPYVTQAFSYFRIVCSAIWPSNSFGNLSVGEFLPIFSAGQTSSTNYGLTWTPTLQTGDAFNVTKNLTVTSAGTGWAQLPAFTPVSSGLTISVWFTLQSAPLAASHLFSAISESGPQLRFYLNSNGTITFTQYTTGNAPAFPSTTSCAINTLYHVVWTIDGSGNHRVYFNGVQDATTASGGINAVTYPIVYIGKSYYADPYPNMTVKDFRMFNRALNAAEVSALYANVNYGQPALGPLTLSDSGEYVLGANGSVAAVGSGYLAGHQVSSYTNPLLSGIDGPIVDTAVSQTGREMVLVTSSRLNNVYYSRDYGATFTGLSIGQSALPSGLPPLARLPLDGSAEDVQGVLSPATGVGTVTYSTSVVKVGTRSAIFSQTVGVAPTVYLNYTVPPSLNSPSVLTMACWVYPSSYANAVYPICFNNNLTVIGPLLYFGINYSRTGAEFNSPGGAINYVETPSIPPLNTWTHLAFTFSGGVGTLYVNGVSAAVNNAGISSLGLTNGSPITHFGVGAVHSTSGAFDGYIDDVRIYNTALSAADVLALYNNAPALANDQSSAMVACSISNDGSYLTVANSAGGVYELNANSTGYTLAIGNQAGAVNQGSNSIAIGNGAGAVNQSANSIVLNATGSSLNTGSSGFYVAPIGTTSGLNMDLLGYGADSQIVKTGIVVAPGGSTQFQRAIELFTNGAGVSNTNMLGSLNFLSSDIYSNSAASISAYGTYSGPGDQYGSTLRFSTYSWSYGLTGLVERMRINDVGNVGIGTTNPSDPLHVYSTTNPTISLGRAAAQYNQAQIVYNHVGNNSSFNYGSLQMNGQGAILNWTGSGNVGIGTTNPGAKLQIYENSGIFGMLMQGGLAAGSSADFISFQGIDGNQRGSITSPFNSTVSYNTGSDIRFKTNIKTFLNPRDYIDQLRPCTFNMAGSSDTLIGFIAQEVKEVLPQLIAIDNGPEHYLYLDYSKFTPIAIAGVKQLFEDKDKLEDRVTVLENALYEKTQQFNKLIEWARMQGFSG